MSDAFDRASVIKKVVGSEIWSALQEVDSLPLGAEEVTHEIDIEEHDLLQHPRVRAMLAGAHRTLLADNEALTSHLVGMSDAFDRASVIKKVVDSEPWSALQEVDSLPLGAEEVTHEIDIEEHDLLQHPQVHAMLAGAHRTLLADNEESTTYSQLTLVEAGQIKLKANSMLGDCEGLLRPDRNHALLDLCQQRCCFPDPEVIPPSVSSQVTSTIADNTVTFAGTSYQMEDDAILEQSCEFLSSTVVLRECAAEDSEPWSALQEVDSLPLGAEEVTHEIDIEEHDLLQHPRVHAMLGGAHRTLLADNEESTTYSQLTLVEAGQIKLKANSMLGDCEGLLRPDRNHALLDLCQQRCCFPDPEVIPPSVSSQVTSDNTVTFAGTSNQMEDDAILEQSCEFLSSTVVLRECAAELQQSGCYCQQCQLQFPGCSTLTDHATSAHAQSGAEKGPLMCDMFTKTFVHENNHALALPIEKEHKDSLGISTHTEEKRFECDHCEYKCKTKSNLKAHLITHLSAKPFKCDHDQCKFRSNQKRGLTFHLRTHTGEKPLKCDQCEYRCCRRAQLKRHLIKHTGENPFKCDQCNFTCSRSDNLKKHLRIHTGEKLFKCDQCEYRCIQKCHLEIHLVKHTGVKPFKCDQCNFTCSHSTYLKKHLRIHTEEKPFKCDQCEYRCIQRSHLKLHLVKHTGVKPFKCDQCNYTCSRSNYLKKHLSIRHRREAV